MKYQLFVFYASLVLILINALVLKQFIVFNHYLTIELETTLLMDGQLPVRQMSDSQLTPQGTGSAKDRSTIRGCHGTI
jgi:hypothetical protein